MANWSDLKASVAQVIKTNGNQEITGQILQNVLNSIINNVGENATYTGIATPSTNPGAPDGNVFYIATQAGTYSNFGGAELEAGLSILLWNGSSWSVTKVMPIARELGDNEDTVVSQKVVKDAINELSRRTPIKSIEVLESADSQYINSEGVISNGYEAYHLLKFQVDGARGDYYVFSPGSISSTTLWKYSDETFSTPTEQIIGGVARGGYFQKVTLQAGYYAFCWNDLERNNGFIVDGMSYIAYLTESYSKLNKYIKDSQVIPCVYDVATIEVGKYINDSGVISDGLNSYKTVKIHLDKGCYYIHNVGNTQQIMCKYTDDTYNTVESIIIGDLYAGYSSFKQLEEGYYAFSWKVDDSGTNDEPLKKAFIISTPFTDDVYKAYINSLFDGVVVDDFLIGTSINPDTGVLTQVSGYYRLAKMYLPAGRYAIISPGSSSQGHFWKYTDGTYETPEEEIISSHAPQSIEMDLDEGYYVFCWNDRTDIVNYKGIIPNAASIRRVIKIEETSYIRNLLGATAFNGVSIINNEIIPQCALTTNTGVIRTDVMYVYKLVKMYLLEGDYYIKIKGSSTQDTLWKFTDSTFETPEKQILGSLPYTSDYEYRNKVIHLKEGYYALSWNDANNEGISPNCAFIMPVLTAENLEKLYGQSISDYSGFSVLNSSFTISGDKKSATSLLTGYSNRLQYKTNLYEDKFNMSTKIIPLTADSNGYFEFCFGKWYNLSGTIFGIGKDADGSFISVYRVNTDATPSLSYKYRITEFSIDLNKSYFININKRTENNSYFDITITNSRGLTFTKKITGKATEDDDTGNEGNGSDAGYAWGKICYYAILGTMRVSDISFSYPVNKASLKLVCSGHSFVEGNSIPQDKDKRYVYLLCNDLGLNDTMILGQGGATTASVLEHISLQLSWLRNAAYILFSIGTNDSDNSTNADKLGQINDIAESYGIKTIWLTISPRNGVGEDHPIMNAYIKEHFNYVDINPAFYLDDGITLDTSAFLDAIHPTVATHKKIYEIIKAQCSYLYCV